MVTQTSARQSGLPVCSRRLLVEPLIASTPAAALAATVLVARSRQRWRRWPGLGRGPEKAQTPYCFLVMTNTVYLITVLLTEVLCGVCYSAASKRV